MYIAQAVISDLEERYCTWVEDSNQNIRFLVLREYLISALATSFLYLTPLDLVYAHPGEIDIQVTDQKCNQTYIRFKMQAIQRNFQKV